MDEITPELVAQIASRLYNETPQAPSVPLEAAPHAPQLKPPAPPMQHLPISSPGMRRMFSAPNNWQSPQADTLPHVAEIPGFAFPTTSAMPERPSIAAPTSGDGLNSFIHRIRHSHHAQDNSGFEPCRRQPKATGTAAVNSVSGARPLDVSAIRKDFPILRQKVHGRPLVWFDNAATTQKPQSVIDAISHYYENDNSNIHRAAHTFAARHGCL